MTKVKPPDPLTQLRGLGNHAAVPVDPQDAIRLIADGAIVREKAGVDEHDRLAASLIAVLDFRIADSKTRHDFVPPQSRPLSDSSAVIILGWWLAVNFTTMTCREYMI